MAYRILNTDGTVLLTLADSVIDQSSTSLTLIGKNYNGYGEIHNNNMIKLLANFASPTAAPPRSPLVGQIWYDTSVRRLKVYDNGFKNISGVTISNSAPTTLQTGDLWFNSTTRQLNILSDSNLYLIGPAYPSTSQYPDQGWVIPPAEVPIKDELTNISKDTLALKTYGNVVALAYAGDKFSMTTSSSATYLPGVTSNREVVSGITIPGDLRVYGQITNNYLSLTLNTESFGFAGLPIYPEVPADIDTIIDQNTAISNILDKTFPPAAVTTGTYVHPGLPVGSVARVLVHRSDASLGDPAGYNVRLFRTTSSGVTTFWQAWNVFTVQNIIE